MPNIGRPCNMLQDLTSQLCDSLASNGRCPHAHQPTIGKSEVGTVNIQFILYQNRWPTVELSHQFTILWRDWLGGIKNHKHEIRVGKRFPGFPNADAFDLIQGMTDSRGIYQLNGNPAYGDRFGDQITRCARSSSYNCAFTFNKTVEEAGLTDVRSPHDGKCQA